MPGIPPIQGKVVYDFKEAINALASSTADAATLAARWLDLCNTEVAKDVTVNLSSGESITVPNLGKVIESLKNREGEINATVVKVHGMSYGTDIKKAGVDVGTSNNVKYADGTARSQHSYTTPYNQFHDMAYVSNSLSYHDSIEFLNVPRYLWFNADSSADERNAHAIAIRPLPANASLVKDRTDRKGVCLCTEFTIINGDPSRTVTFLIHNDAAEANVAASVVLVPGQCADFLVWCYRGADACNVMQRV